MSQLKRILSTAPARRHTGPLHRAGSWDSVGSAQLSVKELGFKAGTNAGIWVHALGLSYLGRRWTDRRG